MRAFICFIGDNSTTCQDRIVNEIAPPKSRFRSLLSRWWKPALTIVLLVLSLIFVRQEGPQLAQALRQIPETPWWIAALATGVAALYMLCCGFMYIGGFRAAGATMPITEAVQLWLRRNFLSVFLPAGGLSSLAFYNKSLRRPTSARPALSDQQIYTGSLVYFVAGYGSLLIVALPVLALGLGQGLLGNAGWSVGMLAILMAGIGWLVQSFRQQSWAYRLAQRYTPGMLKKLEPLRTQSLAVGPLLIALAASVGVELCGIAHVWLAILAVGGKPTPLLALTTYVVATLFFALSPVMRGLGAVETSMTLVLTRAGGLPLPMALAATLYYRLFEFWFPLLLGLISAIWQRGNVLLRVLPAFLTLLLGVVNLLSALTPALKHRLRLLEGLLPTEVIQASNYIIIGAGLLLVLLSIGLLRGYRPAWTLTVALVSLSMVTHLSKAIDYEEALFAALVLAVLLYTQPQYRLMTPSLRRLTNVSIQRRTKRPALMPTTSEMRETARQVTNQFGQSALDYFKLYPDKELVLFADKQAFMAYRLAGRYAVVLEGPVCHREQFANYVQDFDEQCRRRGYQSLYYRVDQDDVAFFSRMGKKSLKIGQEGLVNLRTFSLEGRERKSLRNALKRVETGGFATRVYEPPLRDGLVQQLQAVSDEWLRAEGIGESAFSQGVFRAVEIKQQPIVVSENGEGKVMAFANIIPDYAPDEGTYDLIRKTTDAPSGVSDALLVGLIQYGQQQGWNWLNLGLAPLSGLSDEQDVAERAIKLAYERIRAFAHLRGLRAFKEKYADEWRDKYLLYSEDLDLVQASVAVQRVGRYQKPVPELS